MKKNNITITASYDGHPVIGDCKLFPYHEEYLNKNKKLLDSMLARHNKVMAVRMDLRYPADYQGQTGNQNLSDAMRTYTRELSREGLDPQYVVRREQKESEHPHDHVDLLVNGSLKQRYKPLVKRMAPHWGRVIGVSPEVAEKLVFPCDKHPNGIMIRRNTPEFQEQYDDVHRQMSYLAKSEADDVTPSNRRKVFYSQYKRENSRPKR